MELDQKIHQQHGLVFKETRQKRVIAMMVELAELANEIKFFKFWSQKPQDREAALEEAADVLHFLLSLANDQSMRLEMKENNLYSSETSMETLYVGLMERCGEMAKIEGEKRSPEQEPDRWFIWAEELQRFTDDFVEFINQAGIGIEEIEKEYFRKNAINYLRQTENY